MNAWLSRLAAGCLAGALAGRAQTDEPSVTERVRQATAMLAAQDEATGQIVYSGGFFVASNGMFLTAFRAVRDCTRAQILLWDGKRLDVEAVLNGSPRHDLALLKIAGATNAVSLAIADPASVVADRPVHALAGTTNGVPRKGIVVAYRPEGEARRILYELPLGEIPPIRPGTPIWDEDGRVQALHLQYPVAYRAPAGDDLFEREPTRWTGRGVPAQDIADFLNEPPRKAVALRDLQRSLRQAAAARALLNALAQTDPTFRGVGRLASAARIQEASGAGGKRRLVMVPPSSPDHLKGIRAAMEETLRRSGTPDPQLRQAFEHWSGAMERLSGAVEEIRSRSFGGASSVEAQVRWLENECLQINDQFFAALEAAYEAYRTYAPFDADENPFDPKFIQALYRFYRDRGLAVKLK